MEHIIINLTQHSATPEQIAEGVVDLPAELRTKLAELLTFDTIPEPYDVGMRAQDIASLAITWLDNQPHPEDYGRDGDALAEAMIGGAPYLMCALEYEAMIGGAPYLMCALEYALLNHAIEPVYAFSQRESIEQTQPDGSVRKTNIFRHAGFVRMFSHAGFKESTAE